MTLPHLQASETRQSGIYSGRLSGAAAGPNPHPGEIDGTTIPRGALVLLASANRDEHQYQAPDELRIALATLLPRMANIAPGSDSPIERIESFMLRGPTRLDLRFDPAH